MDSKIFTIATRPRFTDDNVSLNTDEHVNWAARLSFTAYGCQFGICVDDLAVLDQMLNYLPPNWKISDQQDVGHLYSIFIDQEAKDSETQRYKLLYQDRSHLASTRHISRLLRRLESHMQLTIAANSTEGLFVHAGVVGWQGKAILIPGRSFSGKTTLTAALIKAGATYYSDEYAIIDTEGRVSPYPRFLSIRDDSGGHKYKCSPEALGAEIGTNPLPVGLVVMSEYKKGAHWKAHVLSPGHAILAMLDNTVTARAQPQAALRRLQKVALSAKTIKAKRGEASEAVERILNHPM